MVYGRQKGSRSRALPAITVVAVVLFNLPLPAAAQSIDTVAGGGSDDGKPASQTSLNHPSSVALDAAGNLYVSDSRNGLIRRVDANTGIAAIIAGNGAIDFNGDGGPATQASLFFPEGIALDPAGNLYIADSGNHRIRRVDAGSGIISTALDSLGSPYELTFDPAGNLYVADSGQHRIVRLDIGTGIVTTIAGNGEEGFAGDGGPATQASLKRPRGVAIDPAGHLYIGDFGNDRIRRVDAATGIINTIAGSGNEGLAGDGGLATDAAINGPSGLAFDSSGHLHFADLFNHRVRRVDAVTGIISTVAGDGGSTIGDDGPATDAALSLPQDITFDSQGRLYVADSSNLRVRRVDNGTGIISTVVGNGRRGFTGDGSLATQARLAGPHHMAIDATGNLFLTDNLVNAANEKRVRRVDAITGIITTVAGSGDRGFAGDGGPATLASLESPEGVALDSNGNIYFADSFNDRVRRVDAATGIISTVAGNGDATFSGDGGPATQAALNLPTDVVFDSAGRLYITDLGNHRIRRVNTGTGVITTFAGDGEPAFSGDGGPATDASLNHPGSMAHGPDGSLYVTVSNPARVRRIDAITGIIATAAGGGSSQPGNGVPATSALFGSIEGIAVDSEGNLFIANSSDSQIHRVDAATGLIDIVAGDGRFIFAGDSGPATRASIKFPVGLTVDSAGNLYIADNSAGRVRAVLACADVETPDLLTPSNGSAGLTLSPSLAWAGSPVAFGYDVYLDVENPPKRMVAANIEIPAFAPGNLEPLTTYYWMVVTKGDPFCTPFGSAESEVRSFTTESSCQMPGGFATN